MKLYFDSGYVNIPAILDEGLPFNFVVGGRGTGKTYTSLCTCLDQQKPFILLRRTQSQIDIIARDEFSPFKRINRDRGIDVVCDTITKYNSGFYLGEPDADGIVKPAGKPIGYTAALSTFSNIRGFDASDVRLMIFDEFIPERHERPIKNEFDALMNCYETVNRNRELNGEPPLQLLCLANANDIGNPIFMGFELIRQAVKMQSAGTAIYQDRKRGIGLYFLQESKISELKRDTALYRATAGTAFAGMSIENNFAGNEVGRIGSRNLKEYKPVVTVGELTIYKHKSGGDYYASCHAMGSPPKFGTGDTERQRFKRAFGWIWAQYMQDHILFEEYLCEILLNKYYA